MKLSFFQCGKDLYVTMEWNQISKCCDRGIHWMTLQSRSSDSLWLKCSTLWRMWREMRLDGWVVVGYWKFLNTKLECWNLNLWQDINGCWVGVLYHLKYCSLDSIIKLELGRQEIRVRGWKASEQHRKTSTFVNLMPWVLTIS